MPPGHTDNDNDSSEKVSAAGGNINAADPEAAIRGSVASLLSLPIVKAFVGAEGGKRRELVEKGAVQAMGMAERMRTHKYVVDEWEGGWVCFMGGTLWWGSFVQGNKHHAYPLNNKNNNNKKETCGADLNK